MTSKVWWKCRQNYFQGCTAGISDHKEPIANLQNVCKLKLELSNIFVFSSLIFHAGKQTEKWLLCERCTMSKFRSHFWLPHERPQRLLKKNVVIVKLVHGGVHALEGLTAMHKLLQRFQARRLIHSTPFQCRAAHTKFSCTVLGFLVLSSTVCVKVLWCSMAFAGQCTSVTVSPSLPQPYHQRC